MIYITVFFAITLYSLYPFLKKNGQQSKKIFLFLSFATMSVVLGLRGDDVGEDTRHYLHVFNCASNVKWSQMIHSVGMRTAYYTDPFGYTDTIENGFLALAKFVHLFTDDGHVFLFVVAVITCSLFARFIYDNCEKVILPTYIFLCESMFMLAFNGARQILACAIAVQAYTLIKKKRWKSAAVVLLLAALIHNTALVGVVVFLIMRIKPQKEYKTFKYAIVATIASPFIVLLGQTILVKIFPRYAGYFLTNFWTNSLGGIVFLWIIEFALILIAYRRQFRTENSFASSCLVLLYLAFELMGLQITMFSRIGWFFRVYLMIFFPSCSAYFTKKTWQLIQFGLMILMFLLYLSYARIPAREYSFCW